MRFLIDGEIAGFLHTFAGDRVFLADLTLQPRDDDVDFFVKIGVVVSLT
jgi:hypothetical protein